MYRHRMHLLAFVTLTAVLSGCGALGISDNPTGGGGDEPVLVIAEGDPDLGRGLSVAEAMTHRATDDLVTVSGALFIDADGTVRLCDAIAESFPPQCGGERILVEGLDAESIAGLQTEGEVSWAEGVTLFGSVE